jgi:hypothetical protein
MGARCHLLKFRGLNEIVMIIQEAKICLFILLLLLFVYHFSIFFSLKIVFSKPLINHLIIICRELFTNLVLNSYFENQFQTWNRVCYASPLEVSKKKWILRIWACIKSIFFFLIVTIYKSLILLKMQNSNYITRENCNK